MNIFKLIGGIKKKFVEPKVYAIELESGSMRRIWIGAAYSLEEARTLAVKEAEKNAKWRDHRGNRDITMPIWGFVSVSDLLSEYTSTEVNTPTEDTHNALMEEILNKKDKYLLERKRALLTDAEYKYLLSKLTT